MKAMIKRQMPADRSRRSFIKKAVAGAVLAAPGIESLTKSDVLVKSALAQTGKFTRDNNNV